ncbi:MAG TPA: hypothetical protein VF255_09960 [Solirubrobacterales bacterium]
MSSPLVALLEALLFEPDLELDFLAELFFEAAFLGAAFFEAFEAAFLAWVARVALAFVFDFVDLAAFDVFDFAPAFALPPAFFSAI